MLSTLSSLLKRKLGDAGFQKYFKNTSWALFGRIFSLGISFLTTIYVIRHLGPSNYGLLAFSISFVGLFSFISTLGIDSVLYRELSRDITKKDELLGTSFFLRVSASILALTIIFIATYITINDPVTRLLIFINSFTLLFSCFGVIGYFFQAKVQAKYQAVSLILVTAILSTLKILVIFFDKGIIYFSFVFFLENILYAIIAIFLYKKFGNSLLKWKFNKTVAISFLKDSWPLMLSSAFVFIYTRIDQVMIKFITNDYNVGVYDAAARISEIWYFIPALVISSIFPAIVNSNKVSSELFKDRLTKLYCVMFYMAIIVALPVTLLSEHIMLLIYGKDFIQGAGVLSIYVWAAVPVFLTIALNTYLLVENKNIVSFTASAIGMVSNVVLNILLIPVYGIYGAAFATLISYSLIPISMFMFKSSRGNVLAIKDGIIYPIKWLVKNFRN